MAKLNWINCSRLRKYEPATVVYVTCTYCKLEFRKDQVWRAVVGGGKKAHEWCTTCRENSEANNKPKKAAAARKKQMQLNQLELFN
jgi:thioredoxin reductase